MKKKFGLWLNIVTICLCVCAIAIGVYAATSATLTVSGQIGFEAHGIDMDVTAYIYGHSTTADGEPIDEADKVTLIGASTTETTDDTKSITGSQTLSLGTAYFSDLNDDVNGKPTDIYVVVTLKAGEDLKFDVMATASGTSVDDSILITPSAENTLIGYDDTSAKTITFKLSVQPNAQGGYDEIADTNNVSLNIALNKVSAKENVTVESFTTEYQDSVRDNILTVLSSDDYYGSEVTVDAQYLSYAERFPYYINFGKQGTTDLRWLIVSADEGNDTLSTLTNADKRALSAGYMIKGRNYYLLSENILDVNYDDANNFGLAFQNNYTSSKPYPNTTYPDVNANDYATSNIRAYLNDADVKYGSQYNSGSPATYTPKEGTDVAKFTTTYTFSDAEKALIKARKVSDLMNGFTVNKDDYSNAISTDAPETGIDELTQKEDNFWLLSQSEAEAIFAADAENNNVGYMSAISTVQGAQSILGYWWLRSPSADSGNSAWYVYDDGNVRTINVIRSNGVRPAFKI